MGRRADYVTVVPCAAGHVVLRGRDTTALVGPRANTRVRVRPATSYPPWRTTTTTANFYDDSAAKARFSYDANLAVAYDVNSARNSNNPLAM